VKQLRTVGLVVVLAFMAVVGILGWASALLPNSDVSYPCDGRTAPPVALVHHPQVELAFMAPVVALALGLMVQHGRRRPWASFRAAGVRTTSGRLGWACVFLAVWAPVAGAYLTAVVHEHHRLAARAQYYVDTVPWIFGEGARDLRCVSSEPMIHSDTLAVRVDPERIRAGDARRAYREAFEAGGWESYVDYYCLSAWLRGQDPFAIGPTPEPPWRIDTYVEGTFRADTGRVELHIGTRAFYAPEYWASAGQGPSTSRG